MAGEHARAGRSAILTFHSLDQSGSVISFHPGAFRARMEALAESGVPVVPLRECPHRPGSIALTFDDGYLNFAADAWPVLRRLRFPATLFVVSGLVGCTNRWSERRAGIPELPLLGWNELRDLAAEGVELGAHSHTHADLALLAPAQLDEELVRPAQCIEEHTGARPAAFAYPFGHVTAAVRERTSAHYSMACGVTMGYCSRRDDPFDLPRIDAYYLRGSIAPAGVFTPAGRVWVAARAFGRRLKRLATGA